MRYWENLIGVAKIDSNGAGSRTHSRGRRPLRIQVLVSTPDVGVQVPPRAPKPRNLNGFGVFIMPFSVRFALDFVYPTVSRFLGRKNLLWGIAQVLKIRGLRSVFRWKKPRPFSSIIASIDKGTRGSAGRKCPHTASKPLRIHKVFSAAFSLSVSISAPAELLRIGQPWIFEGFLFFWTQAGCRPPRRKGQKAPKRLAVRRACPC